MVNLGPNRRSCSSGSVSGSETIVRVCDQPKATLPGGSFARRLAAHRAQLLVGAEGLVDDGAVPGHGAASCG